MPTIKINWDIFFNRFSTIDALIDFAEGRISLTQLRLACWPKECKKEITNLLTTDYSDIRIEDLIAVEFHNRGYQVGEPDEPPRKQRYKINSTKM